MPPAYTEGATVTGSVLCVELVDQCLQLGLSVSAGNPDYRHNWPSSSPAPVVLAADGTEQEVDGDCRAARNRERFFDDEVNRSPADVAGLI